MRLWSSICYVARYLFKKLEPVPKNLKKLFESMSIADREEIARVQARIHHKELPDEPLSAKLTETGRYIIRKELNKAIDKIGHLSVEEAYWVLIPNDASEAIWIEAIKIKDHIRITNTVF